MTIAELYAAHKSELAGKIAAYSRDYHGAEDAVQQAYLQALRTGALDGLPKRSAVAWLYRTAKNALIDEKRKGARLTSIGADAELAFEQPNADDMIILKELLDKLAPESRKIVSLKYFAGLTSAEIGGALSLSPATVRTKLRAAMKRLRAMLADF